MRHRFTACVSGWQGGARIFTGNCRSCLKPARWWEHVWLVCALFLLGATLLWPAPVSAQNQAALASGKPDYHPGETVVLTGMGWQPGEVVTIVMTVAPATHGPITLMATANQAGNFTDTSYVVQPSELDVTFTATATGDKGSMAQTTFTDSYTTSQLHFGVSPVATGNSVGVVASGSGASTFAPASCTAASCAQTSTESSGVTLTFTATAGSGYAFSSWSATYSGNSPGSNSCTNGGTTNPCSLTVPSGSGNSATITANFVAVATKLAITSISPASPVAGSSFSVTVQSQNASGTAANVAANTGVSLSLYTGSGTLGGTLNGTIAAGASSVTISGVTYSQAETGIVLTASRTSGDSLTAGNSAPFNVTGAPAQLVFGQQPSNAAAGSSISPAVTVQVQDASGNVVTSSTASVTMAIGTNAGGGTLGGTTTVNAVNGIATFSNLSINKVGTGYTLAASSGTLTGATSDAFNITPGTATQLVFTTQPSSTATGGIAFAQQPVVTVEDANGNTVTSSSAAITLAITSGTGTSGAVLTCTPNPVTASSGVAIFTGCSIDKVGTGYTLRATSGSLSGTSSAITVSVGTVTKLGFAAQPSNTQAGSTISGVSVQVQDAGGNVVTSSSASIAIAIGTNPGGGVLSGTTPLNAVNGVANFNDLSINKSGTGYTLVASTANLTNATSNTFNITPGTATQLVFTTQPSSAATGGTAFSQQPVVTVEDVNGNTVTSSSVSVTLAIGTNPSGGSLTCTSNPASASSGVATFAGCKINLSGTGYTLTASSGTLTAAISNPISVSVGAGTKLVIGTQPTATQASSPITPAVTVQVQDAGGNLVTTSTASVAIAIGANPGGGTLSGTTPVSASGGVATFSDLAINKVGTGYTLTASSSPLTSATSSAFNITVAPVSAANSTVSASPGSVVANGTATSTITVTLLDGSGNPVSGKTVTLAANGGSSTISAASGSSNSSGVVTLTVKDTVAETVTYSATDTTDATPITATATVTFTASKLVITSVNGGSNPVAGAPFSVVIQAQDSAGNPANVVVATGVTLSRSTGTGTLGGTLTGTIAAGSNSVTISGVTYSKAESGVSFTATRTSGDSLTAGTSATFTVSAGADSKLAITSVNGGSNPMAGTAFSIVVQAQDSSGNPANVSTDTGVNFSLATGTGTLGGTLTGTIAAGNNSVTISGVTYTKAESGVSVTATATGGDTLTAGTSAIFSVTPGTAAQLAFTTQPGNSATGGTAFAQQPVVTVQDANGNTVTSSNASITLAIGTNPSSGTLTCTTNPLAASSGVATFAGCKIDLAGSGYTLTASSGTLTLATSTAINVTVGAATKLVFGVQPATTLAGSLINPAVTVQVQDAGGNVVTTSTASVAMAIGTNPGSGTLSGTTPVSAANGVATFSDLSINLGGGGYTLRATSGTLTAATSNAFNISQAPSITSASGASLKLGNAGTFTVTATGYPATFTFNETGALPNGVTLNSSTGVLSGTPTIAGTFPITITASNGISPNASQNFTLTVANSVGTPTSGSATFTGTSGSISLNLSGLPASNTMLLVGISNPSSTAVSSVKWGGSGGTPMTLVSGCSATGSVLNNAHFEIWSLANPANINSTVVITFGSSQTVYAGAAAFANASSLGTCKTTSGSYATSASVSLTVPAGGAAFDTVAVNTISSVTIAAPPSGQTSLWNLSSSTSAGAGSWAGSVTTMSRSWNNGTDVYAYGAVPLIPPAAAAQLVFVQQPSNAGAGAAIAPPVTVQLQDANGNNISTSGVSVTLTLSSGTGTLSGTLTQTTDATGLAAFNDLTIDTGGAKSLTATSPGLASAVSNSFNITVQGPRRGQTVIAWLPSPAEIAEWKHLSLGISNSKRIKFPNCGICN